jgi:hypothetical protein
VTSYVTINKLPRRVSYTNLVNIGKRSPSRIQVGKRIASGERWIRKSLATEMAILMSLPKGVR